MDTEALLSRFEREYMDVNSITNQRRGEQKALLTKLALFIPTDLDELTVPDLLAFLGTQLKVGLHVNTVRKSQGMIRSFITWANQADLMDAERTAKLKSIGNPRGSTAQQKPKPYTSIQIREFRGQLAEKYPALPEFGKGSRALMWYMKGRSPSLRRHLWRHARRLQFEAQVALALELGLRRQEIFQLTLAEVHFDNQEVIVRSMKGGPGTQKTRIVPYTTHANMCVQEWLDFRRLLAPGHESPWLALYPRARDGDQLGPLTANQMEAALKPIGDWNWHRLRHTAATEWLRAGVPLEKVRIFMGHSSLDQTLAYAEILRGDVQTAFGDAEAAFAKQIGAAA